MKRPGPPRRWFRAMVAGALILLPLSACGTEPEPHLLVTGQVTSAVGGAGIANASVQLWFGDFITIPQQLLQTVTTDNQGAFTLDIPPPPGYSAPNCATLHLAVSATGFVPEPLVGIGAREQCDTGAVTITITMTPL